MPHPPQTSGTWRSLILDGDALGCRTPLVSAAFLVNALPDHHLQYCSRSMSFPGSMKDRCSVEEPDRKILTVMNSISVTSAGPGRANGLEA